MFLQTQFLPSAPLEEAHTLAKEYPSPLRPVPDYENQPAEKTRTNMSVKTPAAPAPPQPLANVSIEELPSEL